MNQKSSKQRLMATHYFTENDMVAGTLLKCLKFFFRFLEIFYHSLFRAWEFLGKWWGKSFYLLSLLFFFLDFYQICVFHTPINCKNSKINRNFPFRIKKFKCTMTVWKIQPTINKRWSDVQIILVSNLPCPSIFPVNFFAWELYRKWK